MNSSSYSLQSVRKHAFQFSRVTRTFTCQKTATKIADGDKNSLQSSKHCVLQLYYVGLFVFILMHTPYFGILTASSAHIKQINYSTINKEHNCRFFIHNMHHMSCRYYKYVHMLPSMIAYYDLSFWLKCQHLS